jgi:multidrug efflux pump subunit AcrA (membrane-fusion protein)
MKRAAIIAAVLVLVAAVAGGGWWAMNQNPAWWSWLQGEYQKVVEKLGLQAGPPETGLSASGFIEADEVVVTTELGGRITALYADEGDEVQMGQLLVRLDDSLLLGQIQGAEADLALAQATLAQVRAGVAPAKLATARAQLDQAVAAQQPALPGRMPRRCETIPRNWS